MICSCVQGSLSAKNSALNSNLMMMKRMEKREKRSLKGVERERAREGEEGPSLSTLLSPSSNVAGLLPTVPLKVSETEESLQTWHWKEIERKREEEKGGEEGISR